MVNLFSKKSEGNLVKRRIIVRMVWLICSLASISLSENAFSQAQTQLVCGEGDKECAAKAIQGHAVTKLDYWKHAFEKPVKQRIGAAPPELVEYVNLDNIKNGFPERPRSTLPAPDFLVDVHKAIAEMPARVKHLLSAKLAGIYFMENLGGTGYTDQIFDADSNPTAGFVILDPSVLGKQTANAWATWKENTPFKAQPDFRLVAEIEKKPQNNRKNAIQYILLHELAHVLAINEKIHPSWTIEPKDIPSTVDYPFFLLSWSISKADNRFVTLFDEAFRQRKDVVYYFGAKLPADQMVDTYDNLGSTNFATLYSVTSPGDDFAEAFASYVHTVLMKKPFEIRIYKDGKIARTYESCWTQKRCAQKRRVLERFLNQGDPKVKS